VQELDTASKSVPADSASAADKAARHAHHAHAHHSKAGRLLAAATEQRPVVGVVALLIGALTSSFASVYFEKMLKGASKPSLWLRNIQLAIYSTVIALLALVVQQDPSIAKNGAFSGFGFFAWVTVIWQAGGGILVAVTIKYADNILRGFAQGLAIIVAAIGSYFLFDFTFTPKFVGGVLLVMGAILLYGDARETPCELYDHLRKISGCKDDQESLPLPSSDDIEDDLDTEQGEQQTLK